VSVFIAIKKLRSAERSLLVKTERDWRSCKVWTCAPVEGSTSKNHQHDSAFWQKLEAASGVVGILEQIIGPLREIDKSDRNKA